MDDLDLARFEREYLPRAVSGDVLEENQRTKLEQLASLQPPYGQYALIDYLHFKGSGLNSAERYLGIGWGLKQVISIAIISMCMHFSKTF